ncbi:MAG: hypothetical protein AAF614_19885 [Chloroflexota bacterium]
MKVTTPKGWLALVGLLLVIATAVFWATFSTIPTQVVGQGVLVTGDGGDLTAVAYLPAAEGKQIESGMSVQISPATISAAEGGYLLGEVTAVSKLPVGADDIAQTIGSVSLASLFDAVEAPIEVKITLLPDPESPNGYRWTASPPDIAVDEGTPSIVQITVAEQRPIALIVGN